MTVKQFLCTLSGEDWLIVQDANRDDPRVGKQFASIGLFVLFIFLLCFVSSFCALVELFESFWVGIPMGLFFACVVTNIYLFLLYTLSKGVFPHYENSFSRRISIILRVMFVWLIAVFISKPIEVLIFSPLLEPQIREFKTEQFLKYKATTEAFFDTEISNLRGSINEGSLSQDDEVRSGVKRQQSMVEEREREKNDLIRNMGELVGRSNYYVQKIVILNSSYLSCWIITIFVIAIFTVPSAIKLRLRVNENFLSRKRDAERKVVSNAYIAFKDSYSKIFANLYNEQLQFSESYTDPPFNTLRKTDTRKFGTDNDLLREIYDA